MPLYNLCFSVCDTIEAENKNEALEIFADYIKDMRFGEICGNADVEEIKDIKGEQDGEIH